MSISHSAYIFDLDGTLVNSLTDLAAAVNQALAKAGLPEHPLEAYRHFVGNGLERLIRRSLPGGEDVVPEAGLVSMLTASMRVHYDCHWHDASAVYPGIPEMLAELDRQGMKLAVLSNKPDDWTCDFVQHFLPEIPFACVRGAREGVPHKPDPQSALELAALFGLPPEQIVFVGDSKVDILTGIHAGMTPVGVTWGFRDEAELRAAGATRIIHNPAELIAMFATEDHTEPVFG